MFRTFVLLCSLLWTIEAIAQQVYWSGGFSVTSQNGTKVERNQSGGGEGLLGAQQAEKVQLANSREYIATIDKFGGNFESPPAIRTVYVNRPVIVPTYGPPAYVFDPRYYYYGYPPYFPRYYWGAPRTW